MKEMQLGDLYTPTWDKIPECDKNCWAHFHHTMGYHMTHCAITEYFGRQVTDQEARQTAHLVQAQNNKRSA